MDYLKEKNNIYKSRILNKIIFATSKCIGEWFDDPSLEVLFFIMPISASNRVIQYVARLHRVNNIKTEIKLYNYVDTNISITKNIYI